MTGIDQRTRTLVVSAVLVGLLVAGLAAVAWPAAAHEGHDDDEEEEQNFTATIRYEGEVLTLDPAPEQTVTGTTSLEEGSEIAVVLVVRDETPSQRSQRVETGANGTFSATFDLGDAPPDTPITLVVEHETDSGTVLTSDNVRGRIAGTTSTDGQAGPGVLGALLAGALGLALLARR